MGNVSNEGLSELLEAMMTYKNNKQMTKFGEEMFRMYTEMGYPPDMFMSEIEKRKKLPLLAKVYITSIYQSAFLEHKRKSGIDEKRVGGIRRRNREDVVRLIKTGELGVY